MHDVNKIHAKRMNWSEGMRKTKTKRKRTRKWKAPSLLSHWNKFVGLCLPLLLLVGIIVGKKIQCFEMVSRSMWMGSSNQSFRNIGILVSYVPDFIILKFHFRQQPCCSLLYLSFSNWKRWEDEVIIVWITITKIRVAKLIF